MRLETKKRLAAAVLVSVGPTLLFVCGIAAGSWWFSLLALAGIACGFLAAWE